jgi:origin recognition complex subunit 5
MKVVQRGKNVLDINVVTMDIPRLTKFLVLASFLASYNPAKLDARFFTRGGEGTKKVGKKSGIQKGSRMRQQLKGPKAFSIERMLAIFYSIVDEDVKPSFDILSQVFCY